MNVCNSTVIDQLLPHFDVESSHSARIAAPPAVVFDSILKLDMADSPIVRTLFALRCMPSSGLKMDSVADIGFRILHEQRGHELVLGLIGQFWTLRGRIVQFEPGEFVSFSRPGFAKAIWSFHCAEVSGQTRLTTVTRVFCLDRESLRRFRRYWYIRGAIQWMDSSRIPPPCKGKSGTGRVDDPLCDCVEENVMTDKLTTCLWFDKGEARKAAEFYSSVFPDTKVGDRHAAVADFPGGNEGEELTVEFTLLGQSFVGLNGGPTFRPNESVSFMVTTENQEETDRYWNAIVDNGGVESACGWCKDRWGFSWQITPRLLLESLNNPDRAAAKRAFEAMMTMRKIDISTIEAALAGQSIVP